MSVDANGDEWYLTVSAEAHLLIRAHYCFVLVCHMDGTESVRRTIRKRAEQYVEHNQYDCIVALLAGIKK